MDHLITDYSKLLIRMKIILIKLNINIYVAQIIYNKIKYFMKAIIVPEPIYFNVPSKFL